MRDFRLPSHLESVGLSTRVQEREVTVAMMMSMTVARPNLPR